MSALASAHVAGQRSLFSAKPGDTNEATLYTCNARRATILSIIIANGTSSSANATVRWRDSSASTDYDVVVSKAVAGNDTGFINEIVLELQNADLIKITSGTASALTFTALVSEYIGEMQV